MDSCYAEKAATVCTSNRKQATTLSNDFNVFFGGFQFSIFFCTCNEKQRQSALDANTVVNGFKIICTNLESFLPLGSY
jgi:hypothetical protein